MASYNRVIMIGRLVRDPEKRYTASGLALTTFSIAVDRPFKDQATGEKKTDFFRCKAWRQKAEYVADYLQKGRLVAVEGRLETSETVGQDGQKRYFTDVVCDNVEALDSARDSAGPAEGYSGGGGNQNFEDDGYDEAPVAPRSAPQRPAAAAAPARQSAPAQRSAPPQRPAARPAPARAPEPAYPDDDYDDSDPFADE